MLDIWINTVCGQCLILTITIWGTNDKKTFKFD